MTKNTRREILAKLGAGAAALTTLAVAGSAGAQATAAPVARLPNKAMIALASRNRVKITAGNTNVQINVGIDKQGLIISSQRIEAKEPRLGLTQDRKILQLGLRVKDGQVEVLGLDSVLNRGGSVAAEGRCTMRTDPGAAVVLPGEDIAAKVNGLSKF